ncbi:MAG TPA: hypothetical protein VHN39_15170 [Phenylobacterium sp.]|nr:hypothetical protein [Phenylobacterium sp.]
MSPNLASKGEADSFLLLWGRALGTRMSGFKPADAALEGFRITRENPRAFGAWIGASFFFSVLAIIVDAVMPPGVRQGLASLNADQTLTPRQLVDTLVLAAPVLIFALAVLSITSAAVYRLIFRHDDARFGYLRLGADELRLMGLTVICFGLAIILVVAVSLIGGTALSILALAAPDAANALRWPTALLSLAIVGAILVRLSLAPVATFAERRITVFESWGLTRGYFWPLLGAYALALACIVVIGILILIVFTLVAGAVLVATGGQLSDVGLMLKPQDSSLKSYLSVGIIAYMIVSSIFSALWNAVIAAPGAVAYAQLHGAPPSRPLAAQPEAG